ncbi:transposase family protein [Bacteroides sp.]|uniref:transposase family protein n=1 Tax=Bacteroides sp. TaxID=29523 RepID=UPI00345CA8C3
MIIFVSETVCGKTHDKKRLIQCILSLYLVSGYRISRIYAPEGVTIIQPVKKRKVKELSKEQKDYNKKVTCIRVKVENAIGSTKFKRIVKDECRLRTNYFVERIFPICVALHNLRIKMRSWVYKN